MSGDAARPRSTRTASRARRVVGRQAGRARRATTILASPVPGPRDTRRGARPTRMEVWSTGPLPYVEGMSARRAVRLGVDSADEGTCRGAVSAPQPKRDALAAIMPLMAAD